MLHQLPYKDKAYTIVKLPRDETRSFRHHRCAKTTASTKIISANSRKSLRYFPTQTINRKSHYFLHTYTSGNRGIDRPSLTDLLCSLWCKDGRARTLCTAKDASEDLRIHLSELFPICFVKVERIEIHTIPVPQVRVQIIEPIRKKPCLRF